MTAVTVPHVYRALAAITAALAKRGIAKAHTNLDSNYKFRSIDDVYAALAPLLSKHRLCILPHISDRGQDLHTERSGAILSRVWVKAGFEFWSARDGSMHAIETFGEALDRSDKGTAKALSAAYKYAVLQAFCIPTEGNDADSATLEPRNGAAVTPVQGWSAWVRDLGDVIDGCLTHDALDRLQRSYRAQMRSLSQADAGLYAKLGVRMKDKRAALQPSTVTPAARLAG